MTGWHRGPLLAFDLETESTAALTATERKTLVRLLQKVYLKTE